MTFLKRRDRIRHIRKTMTFADAAGTGAVGDVPLFTVTGEIFVTEIIPYCSTSLTGAGATLVLGTTSITNLFIDTTTATDIAAGDFWTAAAPPTTVDLPDIMKGVPVGENILATAGVAAVTAGVIRFDLYYRAVSDDGQVVAV